MSTYYEIRGPQTEAEGQRITISGKEKIIRWNPDDAYVEAYAVEREGGGVAFSDYASRITRTLTNPLRRSSELLRFGIAVLINSVLFFVFNFNAPFARGWRLDVVRRYALGEERRVPDVGLPSLLGHYRRGLVLLLSRLFYFLPLIVVSAFNGVKMFRKFWELTKFVYQKLIGADSMGYVEFFFAKILPEAAVEIFLQLIVVSLYAVFVWPVYRITMIRYATGRCRGSAFFSWTETKKSIRLFRRNADITYGVYAIVLSIDFFLIFFIPFYSTLTLGLLVWTVPFVLLFAKYWVKGVAYGYLGKHLIDKGEL